MTDSETKERKPRGARRAPVIAFVVLAAAVMLGLFLRWPERSAITERAVGSPRGAEVVTAARSLLAGEGFMILDNGERRPTAIPSGEVVAAALGSMVFGEGPAGQLRFQAIVSMLAIVAAAGAALAASGAPAAAATAILLALDPGQIASTRIVSPVPIATFLLALSAAFLVLGLRGTPRISVLLASGIFAGLAATVHPILGVGAAGLFVGSLLSPSLLSTGVAVAGFVAGIAPLFLQRIASYGNPLISSERAAATFGSLSTSLPSAGSSLGEWVGSDAASQVQGVSLEWLVSGDGAIGRLPWLVFALAALAGALRGAGARGLLGFAIGIGLALAGISELAVQSLGLPLSHATPAFLVVVAMAGGVGIAAVAEMLAMASILAPAAALVPAIMGYPALLEAARTPPGLLSPRSEAPATSMASAEKKDEPFAASEPQVAKHDPAEAHPVPAKPDTSQGSQRVVPPKPDASWKAATAQDLARARAAVSGEGGMTKPTLSLEGDRLLLALRLEHKSIDVSMAQVDAARMSIKIVEDNPNLDGLRVRFEAVDGRVLSNATVPAARVRPYIAKLEDPFERRRIRDWWPQMHE